MSKQTIFQGAEAVIIKQGELITKERIQKKYRIPELDEKIRKLRTRAEGKIISKLKNQLNVPEIILIDEKQKTITMRFVSGKKLSDNLNLFKENEQKEICKKIGEQVSKLHNLDIIHGDLTTSNMILKEDNVFFIDFGLSFHSKKIEDKAVDLHLFKQALESKHFQNWKNLFDCFLLGYNPIDKEKILKQIEKVESRGRYKH